ncbi:diguanylate cyclase [Pseudoalteromonas lipolytica SCSIO 04301]|nr:diguanylate cyclase [Pseudoalteromonas lipolytica SCSIO 04301]
MRGMRYYLGLLCLMLSISANGSDKVTLQLKWTHQFQFAGYYMAAKKGFYKDAGLDVTILPADPNNPNTFDQVLNGQADFAITHSGILQQRVQGAPVVALAAMLQFSPYCWMVKNNSDIFQPRDFTGKKLSKISSLENAELLVMLQRAGLDYQSLMAASQKGGIEQWLAGELDAVQVYVTNEPYTLTLRGVGHRLICPQKFGLNVYGDILYTSQAMLKNKPDIVERFYQASLKGWRYALHNMNESINVTQRDYAPHKSMQELAYEADVLANYIQPPGSKLGCMSMAKWRLIADLYNIDQDEFDHAFSGFMYDQQQSEGIELSWMLILAIILSIACVPLYIGLISNGRR